MSAKRIDGQLLVGGVVSLTTVDFPGHLSFVVFCQGCRWRCRYCHNRYLQSFSAEEGLPWQEVVNLINARKNFIDSVVFSGGEPLISPGIKKAIKQIKEMGLLVALHTSGADSDMLASVVNLVDWVGFDVKAPFNHYEKITDIENSGFIAKRSLEILLASHISYEVRISLDQSLSVDEIKDMLKDLYEMGVQNVVLQNIRNEENEIIPHEFLSDLSAMEYAHSFFEKLTTRNTN